MKRLLIICLLLASTTAWAAEEITAYKAKDGTLFESREKARALDFKNDLLKKLREKFYPKYVPDKLGDWSKSNSIWFVQKNAHEIYRILKPFCEPVKGGEQP